MTCDVHQLREHFGSTLAYDFQSLFLGNLLGTGSFRSVYESNRKPKAEVVKLENGYASFHNVHEWEVWQAVKDTSLAKWFAPCIAISGAGAVLVMARTKPVPPKKLPKKIPSFFTDVCARNWGMYRGRVVCHDYGLTKLVEYGMSVGLKTADWDR